MIREELKNALLALENASYRERVMYKWLTMSLKGYSITDFLISNDLKSVALYGYGKIGMVICEEILRNEKLSLVAVIDKKMQDVNDKLIILAPGKELPSNDILIVTINDTSYVKNLYADKDYNIINISEILDGFMTIYGI